LCSSLDDGDDSRVLEPTRDPTDEVVSLDDGDDSRVLELSHDPTDEVVLDPELIAFTCPSCELVAKLNDEPADAVMLAADNPAVLNELVFGSSWPPCDDDEKPLVEKLNDDPADAVVLAVNNPRNAFVGWLAFPPCDDEDALKPKDDEPVVVDIPLPNELPKDDPVLVAVNPFPNRLVCWFPPCDDEDTPLRPKDDPVLVAANPVPNTLVCWFPPSDDEDTSLEPKDGAAEDPVLNTLVC
jgi:hypothetical protein